MPTTRDRMRLRIFVSSPGVVGKEREKAREVLERLAREFDATLVIEPYLWEYEPMLATKDFQDSIPPTAEFDIVVSILWSRLGSRLHSRHRRPDGSTYESGTEYELLRWYFADPRTRSISPLSTMTVEEYKQQLGISDGGSTAAAPDGG